MRNKSQRLNIVIGQIKAVRKMIEQKGDCLAVLTQLKAIRSGITGVMDEVIEDQFDSCLKTLDKKDRELVSKVKNYVKGN